MIYTTTFYYNIYVNKKKKNLGLGLEGTDSFLINLSVSKIKRQRAKIVRKYVGSSSRDVDSLSFEKVGG